MALSSDTRWRPSPWSANREALAAATELAADAICATLGRLQARDMVVLDADGASIIGAYPFTQKKTTH